MELRDLMIEVELQVRKAREDFDLAAHGACREHLDNLGEFLDNNLTSNLLNNDADLCGRLAKGDPDSI